MKVRVLLFARARELVGTEEIEMTLPGNATVQVLRDRLSAEKPELARFLERCAVAISNEYVANNAPIPENAEVAIIPPVSGGSCAQELCQRHFLSLLRKSDVVEFESSVGSAWRQPRNR
jgi:molybdopterin synthase catalytic subunit